MRVVSASGAAAQTAFASGDRGDYAATVVVPKGGIGDLQVGLIGWQSGANGTRRADAMFPITNDPIPDTARDLFGAAEPVSGRGDTGDPGWILAVVGGSLLLLLAVGLWKRRPLSRFS